MKAALLQKRMSGGGTAKGKPAMSSDNTTIPPEDSPPWWLGTVLPTGRYRLKLDPWGNQHLQHQVTDTNGRRKHWAYIETANPGMPDDE